MSSRNPFRQARITQEEIVPSSNVDGSSLFEVQPVSQEELPPSIKRKTKPKKKVVIKTPPRSPEETHRRPSVGRSPSPPPLTPGIAALRFSEDVADTDSVGTADSDLEQAVINTRKNSGGAEPLPFPVIPKSSAETKAPYNPFARTLATSEQQYGLERRQEESERDDRGRSAATTADKPAFDVDMFKNILLNGAQPPQITKKDTQERRDEHEIASDDLRDTTNEQMFETRFPDLNSRTAPQAPMEIGLDSSSDEDEYVDEEDQTPAVTPVEPSTSLPTPASAQRIPQTVAFDDIDDDFSTSIPQTSSSSDLDRRPSDSSDLNSTNKALPTPPPNTDSTQPVGDRTPRKAQPSTLPPPPPASRRLPNSQGRPRSNSAMSKSSMQSDTPSFSQVSPNDTSSGKAPPPPPSRRSLPSKQADPADSASPAEKTTMPPPPAPRRAPSMKVETRSSSSTSQSSLQPLAETAGASSPVPPRPPPRRLGGSNRSSVDGASLARRNAEQERTNDEAETPPPNEGNVSKADLLSDLAALQKEVDELRARAAAG